MMMDVDLQSWRSNASMTWDSKGACDSSWFNRNLLEIRKEGVSMILIYPSAVLYLSGTALNNLVYKSVDITKE